ncbi:MAG: phytanoyl-CoA dioxygenase family protein [Methylacidiphilales bacterium]|nr:phytanoyl-CoA dioxygenase family protein [Candidatus Methylacidiphilales bacterium]
MNTVIALTSRGYELDIRPGSFGEMVRSDNILNDTSALKERLKQDGYLYIPGFFPREDIQLARTEILRRLNAYGGLDPARPIEDAVPSGKLSIPRGGLLTQNDALLNIVFSDQLMQFYARLLGGECRHYDHIWTRVIPPGQGTAPHCDLVYMGRGTHQVMTAWIPYSDVSLELGGLMMLEKSHRQGKRLRSYLESDVDTYCANRGPYKYKNGQLSSNPVTLREKLGGRWLSTSYRMGDLVTFGMKMVHASLDNAATSYRLSTDTRYQLASEPIDPRWVGEETEEYAEKNRIGKIC